VLQQLLLESILVLGNKLQQQFHFVAFSTEEAYMGDKDDRLLKLETDMAYLQDTVAQLNEIVTAQQALMLKLEKQNEALNRRIEDLDTEARPNRKPPHY
jgi:SlyX protein